MAPERLMAAVADPSLPSPGWSPGRWWVRLVPRRVRAVLRLALEDAILVAQDCGDERGERACLLVLHALEGGCANPLPPRDQTVTAGCNPFGPGERLTGDMTR